MKKKQVIMMYCRVGNESQLQETHNDVDAPIKITKKNIPNLFKRTKKH